MKKKNNNNYTLFIVQTLFETFQKLIMLRQHIALAIH